MASSMATDKKPAQGNGPAGEKKPAPATGKGAAGRGAAGRASGDTVQRAAQTGKSGAENKAAGPSDGAKSSAAGKTNAPASSAATRGPAQASPADSAQRFDRMAVRAKLAVSEPGDAVEREADAMADKVLRMPSPAAASVKETPPAAAGPSPKPGEVARAAAQPDKKDQPKPGAKAGQLSDSVKRAAAEPATGSSSNKNAPTSTPAGANSNKSPEPSASAASGSPPSTQSTGKDETVKRQSESGGADSKQSAADRPGSTQELLNRLGEGQPLDADTRAYFEPRIGRDLSHVRIHTDEAAAQAARQLSARAFTFAHHIAFAQGEYRPESENGKRLIAHELAHVLQNEDYTVHDVVQRKPAANPRYDDPNDIAPEAIDPAKRKKAEPALQNLRLPSIKSRHTPLYQALAGGKLKRPAGYNREGANRTKQTEIWTAGVDVSKHYKKIGFDPDQPNAKLPFLGAAANKALEGNKEFVEKRLKIPNWTPDGAWLSDAMQVDHMVEMQVYKEGDNLKNYELLSGAHNMNVGSLLKNEIYENVRVYLDQVGKNSSKQKVSDYLKDNDVPFTKVSAGGEGKHLEATSQFWSKTQIEGGKHLTWLIDEKRDKKDDGKNKNRFALFSPTGNAFVVGFPLSKGKVNTKGGGEGRLGGLSISDVTVIDGFEKASTGSVIGSLTASWTLPKSVRVIKGDNVTLNLTKIEGLDYAGAMSPIPMVETDVAGASPLSFSEINILRGQVYADGTLKPTLSLLSGIDIPVQWRGDDIRFYYVFSTDQLKDKLKVPGLSIDEVSLALFYGKKGIGAEGSLQFSIANMGSGDLVASVSYDGDTPIFKLSGSVTVDRNLFDVATISVEYDSAAGFSGQGTLAITQEGKIKGIKSATVEAGFKDSTFWATGGVEPTIPGLESVALAVTYGKDTLVIKGDLKLKAGLPGIDSGSVSVEVKKKDDRWKVAASGTVTPNFPGLPEGTVLSASYDDGKFNIKVEGVKFEYGLFGGDLTAGVTNQEVDADGKITGGEGGDEIKAYGHGQLKAQLSSWLTAEVGAAIDTAGDIYVSGGLEADSIKIFDKLNPLGKEELELIKISTPKIPVVGVSVGSVAIGVTAKVTGSLSVLCYVGPATLDGLNVKVSRYKLGSDDPLVLTGGGALNLPAYAGLKLAAKGQMDLDAGLVSLGGHIILSATAGVDAHFSSELALAYDENTGVEIMDTTSVSVKPKLAFDVTGGFHVDVNAVITSYEVWSKEWELGHFEYGPDLEMSAMFSMSYNDEDGLSFEPTDPTEGNPPDVSDVGFYEDLLKKNPKEETLNPAPDAPPDTPVLSYEGEVCEAEPEPLASTPEPASCDVNDPSVMKAGNGAPQPQEVPWTDESGLVRDLGEGQPLPDRVRQEMEERFATDFSLVRIHVDGRGQAASDRLSARAFTVGRHIAFASHQYAPDTPDGKRLLAHELAHVTQQQDLATRQILREDGDTPAPAAPSPAAPSSASSTASAPATVPSAPTPPAPSTAPSPSSAPAGGIPASGGATPTGASTSTSAAPAAAGELRIIAPLQLPPIKSRHSPAYNLLASRNLLRRNAGYSAAERRTGQVEHWLSASTADLSRIPEDRRPSSATGWNLNLNVAGGATSKTISASDAAGLNRLLKVPTWDSLGNDISYQVDHMVEYQLGGADEIRNLELLNQAHNGSIGSSFNHEIKRAVRTQIETNPTDPALSGYSGPRTPDGKPTPEGVMAWRTVVFTQLNVRVRESARREGGSTFWTKEQIDAMEHVLPLLGAGGRSLEGTATRFALLSPTGNLLINRFPHGNTETTINVAAQPSLRGGIAGFQIERIQLNAGYNDAAVGAPIGTVEGQLDLGSGVVLPPGSTGVNLPITQAQSPGKYSGKIGQSTGAGLPNQAEFSPMSQLDFSELTIGQGVYGRAVLHPSHPALSGLRIPAQVRDGRVGLFHTVDASALAERLRVPGLSVDAAAITFGYDGEAFSVGGGAEFTVRNFGRGSLDATVDSDGKFQLEGGFRADTRLFDRADMRLWYRSEGGFGGSGTLAITSPNKIRGVRAASVTAAYENGVFTASGSVEPNIPGVQSAGLSVRYGPDENGADSLLIAGDLALAPGIPGINGGTVHVDLRQTGETWSVAANGEVRPNLPGLNPVVRLRYADGLFDGEASADFSRGIFSGNVSVGLTNRAVSPDGEVSGEPGDQLALYGAGNVNARITEWLQGGVGVKVRPSGDLLISGRIGLPDSVTIFDQYPTAERARRTLFSMPTVSVPLVGIAVGGNTVGLALTLSGRMIGYAHVGPGRLTQAEVRIQDFNPAQPETLHISGDARFDLPAAAGVEASIDAGVSLGAAVIRATAGINVSAGVGVDAHVNPRIAMDWTPAAGLHLHAALNTTLSPTLRFGVNGYAEVVADAFVTSFTLWRKDWNLAQRDIGSSLSLGMNLPVDYYSDGRGLVFDPEQVSFQVPELNRETLSRLLNNEGSERVERPAEAARGA